MSDTVTGAAFLALVVGGAWYLNTHNSNPNKMGPSKSTVSATSRAEQAATMQVDAANVRETLAPTLEGKFGGGRMLERVVSTRLADSWRNSELPLQRRGNESLDISLLRAQMAVQSVFTNASQKTAYIFNPERERPIIQGKIRNKFQLSNFLHTE